MKDAYSLWYQDNARPWVPGVYQRSFYRYSDLTRSMHFSYWDGKDWYSSASTPQAAKLQHTKNRLSAYQHLAWRGWKSKP